MRFVLFLACAFGLPAVAWAETFPFEGKWDCEVAEFTFSSDTYNNGLEDLEILDVASEGDGYVLTFADDYQLSLALNPDGTMAWFSPVSGDSFTCRPLP